jgi:hypothetical protein
MSDLLLPELIRYISLFLPPNTFSNVSKSLSNLYNDYWYYEYLTILYPNINLYTNTNYKDLYNKALDQFPVIDYSNIKCVLRQYIRPSHRNIYFFNNFKSQTFYIILTFNGDLLITDGITSILIDNCVCDFSIRYYIKNNIIFQFDINDNIIKYPIITSIKHPTKIKSCIDVFIISNKYCYKLILNNDTYSLIKRKFSHKILNITFPSVFGNKLQFTLNNGLNIQTDSDLYYS